MGAFSRLVMLASTIMTFTTSSPVNSRRDNEAQDRHSIMKRLVLKDRECAKSIYLPTTQQAYQLADQLTKSALEDCTCVLSRTKPVVTIASMVAGGDNIQANIWFTGSNPQTISVAFNCTKLADAITDLIGKCASFSTNNQVGGMQKLSNCITNQNSIEWEGDNPPMAEAGAALEIIKTKREPSPWH